MAKLLNVYQPRYNRANTSRFSHGMKNFSCGGWWTFGLDLRLAADQALLPSFFNVISGGVNGTRIDATGTIVAATTPRYDYDPTTLQPRGLLQEDQATNFLLNSLIDGTNLSTQSVAVSATQYTLSFYGDGRIDLANAYVGSLVGTGAYPQRVSLTFTPAAGTLDLTVTGNVKWAQLEYLNTGNFVTYTSFIPTAGAAVTRTTDTLYGSAAYYGRAGGPYYRSLYGSKPGWIGGSCFWQVLYDVGNLPFNANFFAVPVTLSDGGNALQGGAIDPTGFIRAPLAVSSGVVAPAVNTDILMCSQMTTNATTQAQSTGKAYVNGVLSQSGAIGGYNSTTQGTFCIGQGTYGITPRFSLNGHIKKFRWTAGGFLTPDEALGLSQWI